MSNMLLMDWFFVVTFCPPPPYLIKVSGRGLYKRMKACKSFMAAPKSNTAVCQM